MVPPTPVSIEEEPAAYAAGREAMRGFPLPGNAFVGRSAELALIAELLARDDVRLVTLTGPGGVGKTRLALETIRRLERHGGADIAFVPLGAIEQASGIVPAIASEFQIVEAVEQLPLRLQEEIGSRPLLLVLDNLEHLLPGGGEILQWLLDTCPALTMLVTSRRPTRLAAEHLIDVDPLDIVQDAGQTDSLGGDAVELFILRARRLYDNFQPTSQDRTTIAALCARVDGLPLAIELLASWADIYAPSEMLERFTVHLGARRPSGDPRHRTMWDAITWSYSLLAPEEQALFRRLAVFTGGFQREMAERIAAGREAGAGNAYGEGFGYDGHPDSEAYGFNPTSPEHNRQDPSHAVGLTPIPGDSVRQLAALLDHRLVQRTGSSDGHPRFTMLETVREFGLAMLAEAGEEHAVRHAHAWIMTSFIEATSVWAWTAQGRPWGWDRVDDELPNLRAAWQWVMDQEPPNAELALRLAQPPWGYFQLRGLISEGRRWLEAALALPGGPDWARASALADYGLFCWMQHDTEGAERHVEASLAIGKRWNWPNVNGRAHLYLAMIEWQKANRDPQNIVLHVWQALDAFAAWQQPHSIWLGIATTLEGLVASMAGDPDAAEELFEDAYAHLEEAGFAWGMATVRFVSAENDRNRGQIIPAVRQHIDALRRYHALNEAWGCGVIAYATGCLVADRGNLATAARFFGAARMMLDRTGAFVPPADIGAYEETASRVQSLLGEETYADFAEAGASLPIPAIVEEVTATLEAIEEEERPRRRRSNTPTKLTKNQLDIVQLLIQGKDVEQIAAARGQHPQNIYQILTRIRERWELDHLTEIAPFAVQNGVFTPDGEPNTQ